MMVGFFPVTTFEISFLMPGLWAVYIRPLCPSYSVVLEHIRWKIRSTTYTSYVVLSDTCTRNSENTPQLGVQLRMLYEKLGVGGEKLETGPSVNQTSQGQG